MDVDICKDQHNLDQDPEVSDCPEKSAWLVWVNTLKEQFYDWDNAL